MALFTIYGELRSGAFSSEAALAEAAAAYAFERVGLDTDEQKSPGFLAINPSGKVPALRLPGGEIVTESLAILLTVADLFPHAALLPPPGTPGRAEAYRWLAFMAGEIYPLVELADYPARFAPEGEQAEALRGKARARIRENLLVVERQIAGPGFGRRLLGSRYLCRDVHPLARDLWKDWLEGGYTPKLLALGERLAMRERVAPVWARHFGND